MAGLVIDAKNCKSPAYHRETQLAQDKSLEIPFGLSVPKGRVAMKTGVPKDPPVLDD